MPKIADIQETPNPNAVKFILREPVSHGTSHQFESAEAATTDDLAKSIFEIGNVVSVFYMDKMITVEKTDEVDWDEALPLAWRFRFELLKQFQTEMEARQRCWRCNCRGSRRRSSNRRN